MFVLKRFENKAVRFVPTTETIPIEKTLTNFTRLCGKNTSGVSILTGKKVTGDFNPLTDPVSEDYYQRHLFQYYKTLRDNSFPSVYYPTADNSTIRIIKISAELAGGTIAPNTFNWGVDNLYQFHDQDGLIIYNNLVSGFIDYSTNSIVLTSDNLQYFTPVPASVASIVLNTAIVNIDLANYVTADPSSYPLTYQLVNQGLFNLNGSNLILNSNSSDTEIATYSVTDKYGICSNIGSIQVNKPVICDSTITITPITNQQPVGSCSAVIQKIDAVACASTSPKIIISVDKITNYTLDSNGFAIFSFNFSTNIPVNWYYSVDNGISFLAGNTLSSSFSIPVNKDTLNYNFIVRGQNGVNSYVDLKLDTDVVNGSYKSTKLTSYTSTADLPIGCFPNNYKIFTPGTKLNSVSWSFSGDINGVSISSDTIATVGSKGTITAVVNTPNGMCSDVININGSIVVDACSENVVLKLFKGNDKNKVILVADTDFYGFSVPTWSFTGRGGYTIIGGWNTNVLSLNLVNTGQPLTVNYTVVNSCGKTITKSVSIDYFEDPVIKPSTTQPVITTTTTSVQTGLTYTDLELHISSVLTEVGRLVPFAINVFAVNTSKITATGVTFEITLPNSLTYNGVLGTPNISVAGNIIQVLIPSIAAGDSEIVTIYLMAIGGIGNVDKIFSQIKTCDQIDIDSTPNLIANEDDEASLTLKIVDFDATTTTTIKPCSPIIRPAPYTNYACDTGGQEKRGRILVSAINPLTNDATGLEYSYNGDSDLNYIDSEKSPLLSDGLYTVWVRIKEQRLCKSFTQVRVRCNTIPTDNWQLINSACYIAPIDSPTANVCYKRVYNITPVGNIDGTNSAFIVNQSFVAGTMVVFVKGILLRETFDYTLSGSLIVLKSPVPIDSWITVSFEVSN